MSKQIKLLLSEDVEKLGWLGDVVEVPSGYARNYLIPQGLAMVPTEENLRSLADEKERRAKKRLIERERSVVACDAVKGAEAVLAAKTNEQGHLFGSVTNKDIAENLREQGFEIADEIVKLPEHIKEAGKSEVTLKFAEDVETTIQVIVVSTDPEIQQKLEEAAAEQAKIEAEAERAAEAAKADDEVAQDDEAAKDEQSEDTQTKQPQEK